MSRAIADTSVFIAQETGRPLDASALPDVIALSVITVGELRAGVLSASDVTIRNQRLATLTQALALDPLPVDDVVAQAWALLRVQLRDAGQRMPLNDSWIAATALAHDLPLLTQDRDLATIPGLEVISI